jgi:hypothetical protein
MDDRRKADLLAKLATLVARHDNAAAEAARTLNEAGLTEATPASFRLVVGTLKGLAQEQATLAACLGLLIQILQEEREP